MGEGEIATYNWRAANWRAFRELEQVGVGSQVGG